MATIESNMEKNLAKLEAQLHLWSAKLDELAARTAVKGEEAKIESRMVLDELKSQLGELQGMLDEAKATGAARWQILRRGIERAWSDLENAFKKAVH